MNLKEKFFDLFNLYVEKKTSTKDISRILKKILPYKIDLDLIRLGENNDGGYILPNDLKDIDQNYSAGVGFLTQYENDLEQKYSINSSMLDFNDIDRKIFPNNSKFIKKKLSLNSNVNEISINEWIEERHKEIVLKMDIEGDEYLSLANISDHNLKKIRILVIEFHNLRHLRNFTFFKTFENIFLRLNEFFYPCHLHINNSSTIKYIGNFKIPDMVELTFIRKDRIKNFTGKFSKLPNDLDRKTVPSKDEIFIDKNWYQN